MPDWVQAVLTSLSDLEQGKRYGLDVSLWSTIVRIASLYRQWVGGHPPQAAEWGALQEQMDGYAQRAQHELGAGAEDQAESGPFITTYLAIRAVQESDPAEAEFLAARAVAAHQAFLTQWHHSHPKKKRRWFPWSR